MWSKRYLVSLSIVRMTPRFCVYRSRWGGYSKAVRMRTGMRRISASPDRCRERRAETSSYSRVQVSSIIPASNLPVRVHSVTSSKSYLAPGSPGHDSTIYSYSSLSWLRELYQRMNYFITTPSDVVYLHNKWSRGSRISSCRGPAARIRTSDSRDAIASTLGESSMIVRVSDSRFP